MCTNATDESTTLNAALFNMTSRPNAGTAARCYLGPFYSRHYGLVWAFGVMQNKPLPVFVYRALNELGDFILKDIFVHAKITFRLLSNDYYY